MTSCRENACFTVSSAPWQAPDWHPRLEVMASVQSQIGQKEDQPHRDRHVDGAAELAAKERPVLGTREPWHPRMGMVEEAYISDHPAKNREGNRDRGKCKRHELLEGIRRRGNSAKLAEQKKPDDHAIAPGFSRGNGQVGDRLSHHLSPPNDVAIVEADTRSRAIKALGGTTDRGQSIVFRFAQRYPNVVAAPQVGEAMMQLVVKKQPDAVGVIAGQDAKVADQRVQAAVAEMAVMARVVGNPEEQGDERTKGSRAGDHCAGIPETQN